MVITNADGTFPHVAMSLSDWTYMLANPKIIEPEKPEEEPLLA